MKREILRALETINNSLTLIERRLSTIEKTGATKAEVNNMAIAVTSLKLNLKEFRELHLAGHETRIHVLEESDKGIEDRVLSLERAAGVR